MFLEKKQYQKHIIYWLYSLLLFLLIIVVVGGLTRLTDSGLSITRWEVVTGIFPPLSKEDWAKAFDLYKEIPQYILLNQTITLNEFKVIYYWEYIHRLLGRIFGLLFIIPFVFFIIKKVFSKEYNIKLSLLFFLILVQGFVGWYMVKSGLVTNTTVSHYRLAIHLNIALILFASIYWYLLNFINNENKLFFKISKKNFFIRFFILLIFFQVTLGAFTSGLDAGQVYQTWPLMNNSYFPDDTNMSNIFLNNFFSDASIVQFLHRNMAYLIFVYTVSITFYVFINKKKYLYNLTYFLLLVVFFQIILGVMTLISGLNIFYASMHQISTLLLLLCAITFCYKVKNT